MRRNRDGVGPRLRSRLVRSSAVLLGLIAGGALAPPPTWAAEGASDSPAKDSVTTASPVAPAEPAASSSATGTTSAPSTAGTPATPESTANAESKASAGEKSTVPSTESKPALTVKKSTTASAKGGSGSAPSAKATKTSSGTASGTASKTAPSATAAAPTVKVTSTVKNQTPVATKTVAPSKQAPASAPTRTASSVSRVTSAPAAPVAAPRVERPVVAQEERVIYHYNALGRRDPFQALVGGGFVGMDEGGDAPPDVGGIKVVGIVWGASDKFALVEDPRGNSMVLREGDKVTNGVVEGLKRDALVIRLTVDGMSQSVTIPVTRKGEDSNEGK